MWDMQRRVRPEQFPARRVVVGFEFRDVVRAGRRWWLVSEGSTVDLCVTDPGYEVMARVAADGTAARGPTRWAIQQMIRTTQS